MVGELTAIFAAYGLGVCLVHLCRHRCHWGRDEAPRAVLVTRDAGASVEWHLRMLALARWLGARDMRVTVIDEGSSDETLRIVERLLGRVGAAHCELIRAESPEEAQRWLERLGGEAGEVRFVRGTLAGGAGSSV